MVEIPRAERNVLKIIGVACTEHTSQWQGNGIPGACFTVESLRGHGTNQLVVMLVMLVERQFIVHPQPNENGHGHAHGQPGHVDKAGHFVFAEVPPGDFQIVLEHNS